MEKNGELQELIQNFDWTASSLGDPVRWPVSLTTYMQVLQATPFPMYIAWGPEFIQVYNDAFRPILGANKHPYALGHSSRETFAEIWSDIGPLFDKVMQGNSVRMEDISLKIDRNGYMEEVHFDFAYSPIPLEDGSTGGIFVTVIETTDKVKLMRELRETNRRFEFAIAAAELGTFDYDPVTNVFVANNQLKEWFGISGEGEIPFSEAINCVIPGDRERVLQLMQSTLDPAGPGNYSTTYTIQHPQSGELRVVLAKGLVEFEEGKPTRLSGTLEDITAGVRMSSELAHAEERARLASAAANIGTFDVDLVTDIVVTTPRFRELFMVSADAVSTEELLSKIYPPDLAIRDAAIEKAYETGWLSYEVRIGTERQIFRWIKVEGKILFDTDRKPLRMIGTALEITEQKETDLRREEFIAIASHELRNPLTSLKMSLEMMEHVDNEIQRKFFLQKGLLNVERIMALTNDLLNVSKIAAGMLELKKADFSLTEAVKDSIDNFLGGSEKNKFTVTGETGLTLHGDRLRIEQVLGNLISNASKYSKAGSLIGIDISRSDPQVKITVRDEGIGIAEEQLPFIFKKFSRIRSDNTTKGYGLGLYISKQIVSQHGGEVGVESLRGQGSSFWFTLPLIFN